MKNLKIKRKEKIKNLLNIGILVFGLLFTFTNCEKENEPEITFENQAVESDYTIIHQNFNFIKDNDLLLEKISKLSKNKKKESSKNSKIETDEFTIFTDRVTYISSNDNLKKSYSFYIESKNIENSDNNSIENLILSSNNNNKYRAYIIKYYFPEGIYSGRDSFEILDYKEIDVENVSGVFQKVDCKESFEYTIIETKHDCYSSEHSGNSEAGQCNGQGSQLPYSTFTILMFYNYDCGYETGPSGGNLGGEDPSGIPNGSDPPSNGTPTVDTGITLPACQTDDCDVIVANQINDLLGNTLSYNELLWLNNNNFEADLIKTFLDNNNSIEAKNFAEEAIELYINLDNFNELLNSPDFDPLNNPWLNSVREYAEKILNLKGKISVELWEGLNRQVDNLFIAALTKTALKINPNADTDKDANKDYEFKNNGKNGVGILLYEFANGEGPDERHFSYSEHDFAKQFLSGNVPNDIKNDFLDELNNRGLTFEQFVNQGNTINGSYSFSPDHTTASDSFNKHVNANWVQFFIGGANAKYSPSSELGWIEVTLENPTSRNSLLLHQAESYPRDTYGAVPLSTIKQFFHFKLKIQ